METDFAPLRLVPFAAEHEAGVISVIRTCYAEYGQVLELDTLDGDLRCIGELYLPPESTFCVLLDGDRVVGSVAVKGKDGGEAELKRLFLLPSYRGRGLGRRLTLWAFEWARRAGYEELRFWSDVLYDTAHRLYLRLGAVESGERRVLGGRNRVEEKGFFVKL